jgi:hypothetical protein
MEWVKAGLAFVKEQSGPVSFATLAVAAAVIWTPFGRSLVRLEWLPYVNGIFLVATVASLAQIFRVMASPFRRRRRRQQMLNTISGLSAEAKAVLGAFMHEDVIRVDAREATIDVLNRLGFIHRPRTSQAFFVFDFTLDPLVRKLLAEHPEVLEGAAQQIEIERFSRDENPMHQLADRILRRR